MRSWMIAYLLGVALYHLMGASIYQDNPSHYVFVYFVSLLVLGLATLRYRRLRIFLVMLAGFFWSDYYVGTQRDQTITEPFEGVDLVADGYICSIPKKSDRVVSFDLCNTTLYRPGIEGVYSEGLKVKLNWYSYSNFSARRSGNHHEQQNPIDLTSRVDRLKGGQTFLVRLKKPHGLENPYSFSYERWLLRNGFDGKGYVKREWSDNEGAIGFRCPATLFDLIDCRLTEYRIEIAAYIDVISDRIENTALIKALTIGYRGDIDEPLWKLLRNTGTQHLIAISGLHIGLVFAATVMLISIIMAMVAGLLPRGYARFIYYHQSKVKLLLALSAAFIYSALAGFTISTQRALIMIAVFAVSGFLRSAINNNTRLMFAAVVVLIIDPESVFDYGFWLSFSAVYVMLLGLSRNLRVASQTYVGRFLLGLRAQWVITIGLSPVLLSLGLGVSYSSIVVNILAIPLVGIVTVPTALLGVLMSPLSNSLSLMFINVADTSLQLFIAYAGWFTHLESISFTPLMKLMIVCVALLTLCVVIFPLLSRFIGWVIGVLLLLVIYKIPVNVGTNTEVVVFDVGQGLAFAATRGSKAVVYDTGPSYTKGSAAERSMIPYLTAKGITELEVVVVSHGDDDHMGGLSALRKAFTVDTLIVGEPRRFVDDGLFTECSSVTSKSSDWYEIRLYSVVERFNNRKVSSNNHSCVMKIRFKRGGSDGFIGNAPPTNVSRSNQFLNSGNKHGRLQNDRIAKQQSLSFLLTGDLDLKAEALLATSATANDLQANVLIAGHHGSKYSTGERLLEVVLPETVVFSSGYKNRFNHPHPDTLDRVKAYGATIFATANDGAIMFTQQNSGLWEVKSQRVQ